MSDGLIVLHGSLRVPPDATDTWMAAAADLVRETRQEAGCLEYAIGVAAGGNGWILFYEVYTDETALATHLSSPHMAAFAEQVARVEVLERVPLRAYSGVSMDVASIGVLAGRYHSHT